MDTADTTILGTEQAAGDQCDAAAKLAELYNDQKLCKTAYIDTALEAVNALAAAADRRVEHYQHAEDVVRVRSTRLCDAYNQRSIAKVLYYTAFLVLVDAKLRVTSSVASAVREEFLRKSGSCELRDLAPSTRILFFSISNTPRLHLSTLDEVGNLARQVALRTLGGGAAQLLILDIGDQLNRMQRAWHRTFRKFDKHVASMCAARSRWMELADQLRGLDPAYDDVGFGG